MLATLKSATFVVNFLEKWMDQKKAWDKDTVCFDYVCFHFDTILYNMAHDFGQLLS